MCVENSLCWVARALVCPALHEHVIIENLHSMNSQTMAENEKWGKKHIE